MIEPLRYSFLESLPDLNLPWRPAPLFVQTKVLQMIWIVGFVRVASACNDAGVWR
jgi:hypothetical protein